MQTTNIKFISIIVSILFACFLFFSPISAVFNLPFEHAYAANGTLAGDLTPGESGESWIFSIWDFSLNLVNMALIGILLFLAVVNILNLNIDTYALKKFLLPLIVSVILANFSMFICRAIVEFATALTGTFLKDYNQITDGILTGLSFGSNQTLIQWSAQLSDSSLGDNINIGQMFIYLFLGLVAGLFVCIVLLLLSLLLYVRWFIVLILAAVSPLIFIFMVLPITQNLFRQWWNWFLRWVFMGPVVSFVLYVAAVIGKSSQSGTGTNSWVSILILFIITLGLMILALFVPFMLGGQFFNKVASTAKQLGGIGKFAGNNVPGVMQASQFVGGMLDKRNANIEASKKQWRLRGHGFADNGIAGMKSNVEQTQMEEAQKEAKRLVDIDKPLDSATLSKQQRQNPHFIEQYMKALAKNKRLDSTELNKIIGLHLEGKIKNSNIKNTTDLENAINHSLDLQKDQYARDHQSAPDINNPLSQYALDTNGNIQKDSSGRPILLSADDVAVKNANNHINDYEQANRRTTSSPRDRQNSAKKVIDALKMLDSESAKGASASNQYNTDKHKQAIANFQALEQSAENDPSLQAITNSKTFQELSLKHGISNKISSVVENVIPGMAGNLGSERKRHLREMLGRSINVYDTTGAPQEHQIRKILIAKDAMHAKMQQQSLNINNDADVKEYINKHGGNDDIYENFQNNNDSVKQNSVLAQQIAAQLRASGNISAPDTKLF